MGQWFEYSGVMVPLSNAPEEEEEDDLREELDDDDCGINYEGSLLFEKGEDERWDIRSDDNGKCFDSSGEEVDQHIKFIAKSKDLTSLRKVAKEYGLRADFKRARYYSALHYDTVDSPCDMMTLESFGAAKDNEVLFL